MKFLYAIMFLFISLNCTNALAADPSKTVPLSQEEKKLSIDCNLAARNALINGDLEYVEKVCMQAIDKIGKSHPGQEQLVHPIMNLAFSFTLSGQFDRATPLYNRARTIREKLYGPDSMKLKEIDNLIKMQEGMKKQHSMKSSNGS